MAKQVAINLPAELEAAVDSWRAAQPVPPPKSAALVVLIRAGMRALAPEFAPKD